LRQFEAQPLLTRQRIQVETVAIVPPVFGSQRLFILCRELEARRQAYSELVRPRPAHSVRYFADPELCLADPRDIPRDRRCNDLLAVCVDLPAARKRAVDRVEP